MGLITRSELKKKDWQLLTAEFLMENQAILRTIVQQNNRVMSKLYDISIEEAVEISNGLLADNRNSVQHSVVVGFPEYDHTQKEE